MKNKIRLTESELISFIKNVINEEQDDEILISPNEYIDLLRKVYFQAQAIPRLPRFRGKKLVVDGNLDLTSFRNQEQLTDLGNIARKERTVPKKYLRGVSGPTQAFVDEFICTIGGPGAIPHYSDIAFRKIRL